MYKTTMDYQNEVSRDIPPEVREAARLSIWLIGDCGESLTHSLNVSTKKFGAKVAPTKKIVKSILPAGYLRKKTAARMSPEIKEIIKVKKIAEYEAKKFQKNEESARIEDVKSKLASIKERQAEGIAKARARGAYANVGRKGLSIETSNEIKAQKENGIGATEIALNMGVGRSTVYKVLSEKRKETLKEVKPEIVIAEKRTTKKLTFEISEEAARKYKAYAAIKGVTMSNLFLQMFNKSLSEES